MNINTNDKNSPSLHSRRYIETLHNHGLFQHVDQPTRNGKKPSTTLHQTLITFWPQTFYHATRSVTMMPYIAVNICKQRYTPRFKCIRREKDIGINAFKTDIEKLPFNLVYAIKCPDEKLDIFNKTELLFTYNNFKSSQLHQN